MEELAKEFPQGWPTASRSTPRRSSSQSIDEVYKTLIEAGVLVLIVILVFLQDWRAMLVPATTVPVTIIGAFAAMAAMGFSVNLSTLFALVLAIGIVVDDAIVVVEGAAHNIEQRHVRPRRRDRARWTQLFGPIIGITLVLMAVFLPAAFLPGLTGQMYAQFALVIAATALISAINAATLKPTQCAMWLRRPVPPEQRNFFYRGFNRVYERVEARLCAADRRAWSDRSGIMVAIALAIIAACRSTACHACADRLPADRGPGLSARRRAAARRRLARPHPGKRCDAGRASIAKRHPGVDEVVTIAGISALDNNASLANAGVAYIILKDWSERGKGEDLAAALHDAQPGASRRSRTARVLVLPPPPIQGIGNAAGFTMQIELRDGSFDLAKLQSVGQRRRAGGRDADRASSA